MKKSYNIIHLFIAIFLAGFSVTGTSAEFSHESTLPANKYYTQDTRSFMLAANDNNVLATKNKVSSVSPATEFEPPFITASKAHQYLGISTVVLGVLTGLTHPEECEENNCPPRDTNINHAKLAKATVAMAAATIATGLYAHWHDISLAEGISDPDNLHVLLAGTGAMLLAYAVNRSANSSVPVEHAGFAETGLLAMVVAVKLTW